MHKQHPEKRLERFWLLTPGGYLDELLVTYMLQNKFGLEKVNGGPYVNYKTGADRILSHLNNSCFGCGEYGHQQRDCHREALREEVIAQKKLKVEQSALTLESATSFVRQLYKILNFFDFQAPEGDDSSVSIFKI